MSMKKTSAKFSRLLAWFLVLSLSVGLMSGSRVAFAAEDDTVKITVIHTNDIHSRVDIYPYVAALAKERKAAGENVLLLDAGDALHGQPIATISEGRNIVDIMNAVGYDAMAPGNHDFNYGVARLDVLAKRMNFPVLAANVKNDINDRAAYESTVIKEVGGVKVGIFGLATPETKTKTNPSNVRLLKFENPVPVAGQMTTYLKDQGCDVVIALSHLGMDQETWAEERSTAIARHGKIDLIIDGHSHDTLEKGMVSGSSFIVQTGSYGANIGVVELTVKNGKVTDRTATLLPVPTEDAPNPALSTDSAVLNLIESLNKANEAVLGEVVGSTPVTLQGERDDVRTKETNFGNLINDAILAATGADIAITNGGNIRVTLPAGNITKGDVLTVLPFGNYVVVKEYSGADIIAALEHGLKAYPASAGGFPQVGGITFTFDASSGNKITEIKLSDGTPLDANKMYRLATNDFLAEGGDGYDMLAGGGSMMIYKALDEIVIDYLQLRPAIKAGPEGRINVIGGASQQAA